MKAIGTKYVVFLSKNMTEINLPLNAMKSLDFEVTKEYTAAHIGSGSVSVLATPSMILFMEIASGMLAHDHIPQGYTSVGTRVCVDHLDAVLEGNTVQAISVIAGIDKPTINPRKPIIPNNNNGVFNAIGISNTAVPAQYIFTRSRDLRVRISEYAVYSRLLLFLAA